MYFTNEKQSIRCFDEFLIFVCFSGNLWANCFGEMRDNEHMETKVR